MILQQNVLPALAPLVAQDLSYIIHIFFTYAQTRANSIKYLYLIRRISVEIVQLRLLWSIAKHIMRAGLKPQISTSFRFIQSQGLVWFDCFSCQQDIEPSVQNSVILKWTSSLWSQMDFIQRLVSIFTLIPVDCTQSQPRNIYLVVLRVFLIWNSLLFPASRTDRYQ